LEGPAGPPRRGVDGVEDPGAVAEVDDAVAHRGRGLDLARRLDLEAQVAAFEPQGVEVAVERADVDRAVHDRRGRGDPVPGLEGPDRSEVRRERGRGAAGEEGVAAEEGP